MNTVIERTKLHHEEGKHVLSAFVGWRTQETNLLALFVTVIHLSFLYIPYEE